jgi:uncharacterized membrane-anchored protein
MKRLSLFALALLALSPAVATAQAPEGKDAASAREFTNKIKALHWVEAQSPQPVTYRGNLKLNGSDAYLGSQDTAEFLRLNGNLSGGENYVLAPKISGKKWVGWFAVYTYNDMGYVKDKETIDADALLKTIREGQEKANEQLQSQGMDTMNVIGWSVPPHYNPATHNLEYGLRLSSRGSEFVNYHMRMLGRHGVTDANLVSPIGTLEKNLAEFRKDNEGFSYVSGEKYADYQDGDKVSEFGLAALITGGAAVAAVKTGFFGALLKGLAVFWKFILIGIAAIVAGMRKFFGKIFGRKRYDGEEYRNDDYRGDE